MTHRADQPRYWRVETRVTSTRTYYVEAANAKEAEAKTSDMTADHEEDDNEETMSIEEYDGPQ